MPPNDPIPRLTRAIGQVRRRLRVRAALTTAVRVAGPSAALAALGLLAIKLDLAARLGLHVQLPIERALPWALSVALVPPMLAALAAGLRRRTALDAAARLDEAAHTASRMANAWVFAATPPEQRSAFQEAAIRDARLHLTRVDPARAAPLRRPSGLGTVALAALGLVAAAALRSPAAPPAAEAAAPSPPALLLAPEDLQAFEDELRERGAREDDPPALSEGARELARLLQDLRERRVEERAALGRVDALTRRFLDGRPADSAVERARLARLGEPLEGASSLRAAAQALREGAAERAARELSAEAERIAAGELNRAELLRVRRALERAAREAGSREHEDATQARERQERLLRRAERQPSTPAQRRLLEHHRRQLERLRREEERAQAQRRQLARLERDLRDAAAELGSSASGANQGGLSRAAEDLHRMGRQQAQDERSQALGRQLEQLREMLRRQRPAGGEGERAGGQGPGGAAERRRRFSLRAGGQPVGLGRRPGQGGQDGADGDGMGGMAGATGMGGAGGMDGQGSGGMDEGLAILQPGSGGAADALLELPGGEGTQDRGGGQRSGTETGPGAGVGHDETRLDDPTTLAHRLNDSRLHGQASEGPSRSQVIDGAAARGFVGQGYERVYGDYRGHSEEVLERDRVPPGYRFYVRRYFQLIRPREVQP